MANRYLIRSLAGDHIASDEAEVLEWLKHGHCGCGDYVFIEASGAWAPVCELPGIAQLFASKPSTKLEKPVITVFKLGRGRSLQEGPFTLSTVLEMLGRGELCAQSWIYVEGDKDWRQVRNVKVLREALPTAPAEPPRFGLTDVSQPQSGEVDFSYESLQSGLPGQAAQARLPAAASIAAEAQPQARQPFLSTSPISGNTSVFDVTSESQPSIVPLPPGLDDAAPPPRVLTKTATLVTKVTARVESGVPTMNGEIPSPPNFTPTTAGFTATPDLQRAASAQTAAAAADALDLSSGVDGDAPPEVSVRLVMPGVAGKQVPAPPIAPMSESSEAGLAVPPDGPRFEYRQENAVEEVPEEEQTKAVSKLGLSQKLAPSPDFQQHSKTSPGFVPAPAADLVSSTLRPSVAPPPPPAAPAPPPARVAAPPAVPPAAPASSAADEEGIVVEIPQGAIWLIKQERSERVTGPYAFQQVITMLRTGQITKEDKISKQGSNRFNKISQQYEFNVKYSVETVVEQGVERQKILIKRRHPRVAYMADVHVMKVGRKWLGKCVNISAGGILLESTDLEATLGETLTIEIMPGPVQRKIAVNALLIGKIPKKPPGFALKFIDLKIEDKEAIEFFVVEALKKEKAMGM